MALAGGKTPQPLYALLASQEFTGPFDWSRVHVFWGDERCVAPDDVRSNYRMARDTWLDHVSIPDGQVHRILGEAEPTSAAAMYEEVLRALFENGAVASKSDFTLDLVLLGLGEDGHTASLFPGRPAVLERMRWVLADRAADNSEWRVTLTPVALNLARHVLFVVSGASKAGRVKDVFEGPFAPQQCPAQAIRPARGSLTWFVDLAAAAELSSR